MAVSVGLCNWHFLAMAVMQIPTSAAIMQVLFWGSIAIMLVVLSHSATLMLVNLFVVVMKMTLAFCMYHVCCNYAVRSFFNTNAYNACESFCRKYVGDYFYWNYAVGSLFCNHAGGIFIVIMQVAVSIAAICICLCDSASSI